MQIIIVGAGKVGRALVEKLSGENHNITVIDSSSEKVNKVTQEFDVMGIIGNGASISVLSEAGAETADVFIAVTGSDELNLLCCMFAKKVGDSHTIARVRNPIYSKELEFIKKQLEISAIINPELACAREISKLLQFPVADNVETFADDRVNLIKFKIEKDMGIDNIPLKDIPSKIGADILVCAVERGDEVVIPDGNFTLKENDLAIIAASKEKIPTFFSKINRSAHPVKSAIIVGGGTIGFYLAKSLEDTKVDVRIIEHDAKKCDFLSTMLPNTTILLGDGTDRSLLMTEGLETTDSFITLTGIDEENVLMSLFAKKHSNAKLVTKINRLEFDDILGSMDIGSVFYPKYITCDFILQHIRSLQNESGSNLKTLYNILDDRVEALEFEVSENCPITGITFSELELRKGLLICCIMRDGKVIIPRGSDSIQPFDNVIVVTLSHGLKDIQDILA